MTSTAPSARADLGIFGGSGFTSFLDDCEPVALTTPWGDPSDALTLADVDEAVLRKVIKTAYDQAKIDNKC